MDILNTAVPGAPPAGGGMDAMMAQMLAGGGGANPAGGAPAAPSMGAPPPPMMPPLLAPVAPAAPPILPGGTSPGQNACRFGMRCSSHFTQAWEWYSGFKGTGNKDPGNYNDSFL